MEFHTNHSLPRSCMPKVLLIFAKSSHSASGPDYHCEDQRWPPRERRCLLITTRNVVGMRTRLTAFAAVSALLSFSTPQATAQINPFRSSRNAAISEEDNRLMFDSIDRLNRTKPLHVGQSDSWSNPKTGTSGTSTVQRIYRSHGMPCHLLRHRIVVQNRQPGRTYNINWCQTASGEWKSAE